MNAKSRLSFWSPPGICLWWSLISSSGRFFVYFYYLLENMCLSKMLSEKEEGQGKKWNLCFLLFLFHDQAWKGSQCPSGPLHCSAH